MNPIASATTSLPVGVVIDDPEHVSTNVDLVLDVAHLWKTSLGTKDEIAWYDAAKVGGITWREQPSPAFTRFVALWLTPASDPRRASLLALCDELDSKQGMRRTAQGTFRPAELRESDDTIRLLQQTGALPAFVDPRGRRT